MQVYVRIRGAPHEYEWRHGTLLRRLGDDTARELPLDQQQPRTDTSKSSSSATAATMVEVALSDGSVVHVDEVQDVLVANALPEGCESLAGVENLDALTHLHEASFVDYLQHRYDVDEVYCKSGAVLIAVNPFKDIAGLYDMHTYRARITGGSSVPAEQHDQAASELPSSSDTSTATTLPPHVFSIAESAFRSLQQAQKLRVSGAKRDQTILVSGESGAGKTETTKFVMNYLADVSSASADRDSTEEPRSKRVGMSGSQLMSANPILESFGNARTLRNDNSSRFGKFVRMFFDAQHSSSSSQEALTMVGTSVDTYLLEKVRVIHQTAGERNYHVFYELLAGADASRKQALHLNELSARDFQYTRGGNCFLRNDGVQDAVQFARVCESLAALDFSDAEQTALWRAVSALLHLGNVSFIPSTDDEDETNASAAAPCRLAATSPSQRSPAQHMAHVASLLGVERDAFLAALTTRKINISGECFLVNLSQAQCSDARDAMARSLYGLLFQYLVTKINANAPQQPSAGVPGNIDDNAPQSSSSLRCIAVLDIFGFEEFDVNLFEQFCINYANEKLQFQFIHDILVSEQQAHVDEGIPWRAVEYQDNAQCLEMLEQRPTGIFAMLDEECIIPKGSDAGFARKMYLQLQHHAHFSASRKEQADAAFTIHHYAGHIQYDTRGFCEKNKDQPNAELFSVLHESRDAHLSALFRTFIDAEQQRQTTQQPKLRRRSSAISAVGIASQFKQQLAGLIDVVQQTQTHYIRCIKPNDCSARNQFDALKVASQLRYGGVLKAVEIMRQSFPVRMPHAEFVAQYRVLLTRDGHSSSSLDDVHALVKGLAIEQVEVGKTRVFLRQSAFDALEKLRDRLRLRSVVTIQSHWKARVVSRRYHRQRSLVRSLQLRWRAVQELKRRWRRRDCAVKVLQRASRQWLAFQYQVRDDAAVVLQRAVRLWCHQLAARRKRLAYVSAAARSAKHSSSSRHNNKSHNVDDDDDDDDEKRFGSLAGLQAPPVDPTDRGSMASYSIDTSSYSEDPVDELLDVHTRSASNASLLFEEVARAPENTMLRQALEELERLRYRAEAAEAALAQLAPDNRMRATVSAVRPTASLGPSGFASRLERPSLLDLHAGIAMDVYGNTALHHAVAKGDVASALALLTDDERGAAMLNAAEHQQGMTPLHVAVKSGNSEIVGLFFRPDVFPHVDVDCSDRDGNTPLHLASQLTFDVADRVMELLLCFGASANAANYLKQTPLHLCAMIKRTGASSAELMAKLLRHDADPQKLDFLKRTPLHYCMEKGMEDEAILLMRHGADPNIPDAEGVRVVTHPKATNLLRYLRVTPSWIADADVLECMVCVEPFAFFSRKHHCDRCGRVCCSDCSSASSSWKGRFCFDCKHYQHATV